MQLRFRSRETQGSTAVEAERPAGEAAEKLLDPPSAPRLFGLRREVDVAAKIESSLVALRHAVARTEEVAAGRRQAYSKLHGRLRQSVAPFADLFPADVRTLPREEAWRLGIQLGDQVAKLVSALPAAIDALERDGRATKGDGLHRALQGLLEELARKLELLPIVPPELVPLLGEPPRIDAENAPAILERLKVELGAAEDQATPEQRIAALFLTESVGRELEEALASKGNDASAVSELVTAGQSRRHRIGMALRRGAATAAVLAVSVPSLVFGAAGDAPERDTPPFKPEVVVKVDPRPIVEPRAVHDPITIRIPEAPGERLDREATRAALVAPANAEDLSAGVPAGVPRLTVAEHLVAAGFPEQATSALTPKIDPLEQAVATFQASVGLDASGQVTIETWDRLEDSILLADPKQPAFSPPQALGERSDAVKKSEQIMAELGVLPAKAVDGVFDAKTLAGSRQYEQQHPGLGVDGAIDLRQFRSMVRDLIRGHTAKPKVEVVRSPNQSSRGGIDIDAIVLHHTASNSTEGDLATLTSAAAKVSANFLIGRDGTIFELVPEEMGAWHAGVAHLHGQQGTVNARSIGIEITNDGSGHTPFTPEQYRALEQLVPYLVARHNIPIENIVGHKDVALPQGRKTDPAPNFDEGRVLAAVHRVEQLERQLG